MRFLSTFVTVISLTLSTVAWTQETPTSSAVSELIVKSGLKRQLEQMPDAIRASMQQEVTDPTVSAEEKAKLEEAVVKSFNPAVMLKTVEQTLSTHLTNDDLTAILTWLNSSLGQKITRLEEDASSAEGYNKLVQFGESLQTTPPDPSRVQLLQSFDQAARLSETIFNVKTQVAKTMIDVICASMQEDCHKADVLSQIEQSEPMIKDAAVDEAIFTGLFTYQTLTDAEIQSYIDFLKSAPGQKYAAVMTDGLLAVMREGAKRMGEELVTMMPAKKPAMTP